MGSDFWELRKHCMKRKTVLVNRYWLKVHWSQITCLNDARLWENVWKKVARCQNGFLSVTKLFSFVEKTEKSLVIVFPRYHLELSVDFNLVFWQNSFTPFWAKMQKLKPLYNHWLNLIIITFSKLIRFFCIFCQIIIGFGSDHIYMFWTNTVENKTTVKKCIYIISIVLLSTFVIYMYITGSLLIEWLIDWMVFYAAINSISAGSL